MNIMYEDSIKRDLKTGNFASVYVLFGDDTYLKKHYSDAIIQKVCSNDTDFNLQVFDETADLQSVYDSVNQFPMMADKKCVCLNDYDFEHADKTDLEKLCNVLSDVPDTTVFIVKFDCVEFDIKKSAKVKKILSAVEKSNGRFIQLKHRSISELSKMLVRGAAKRRVTLSDKTARYLIETSGEDISILTNELDKLCSFSNGGEITESTVDLVCAKTVDASVYDYVKEIFACNITNALSMLDSMFYMHIEALSILYATAQSYIDMYRIYSAKQSGVTKSEIAEDFSYGGRAFTLDRAEKNLRKMNSKKLKASFEEILKTDKMLKSFSADERIALEELTVKLVVIIASDGDNF